MRFLFPGLLRFSLCPFLHNSESAVALLCCTFYGKSGSQMVMIKIFSEKPGLYIEIEV